MFHDLCVFHLFVSEHALDLNKCLDMFRLSFASKKHQTCDWKAVQLVTSKLLQQPRNFKGVIFSMFLNVSQFDFEGKYLLMQVFNGTRERPDDDDFP
jgi:hypothetical protein